MILQSNLDMFMYYIFVTRYAYLMCSDIYTYAVFAFAQVVLNQGQRLFFMNDHYI